MNDLRWQHIERIFHEALEMAPADRSAFLDDACGSDEALRGEIESLLAHDKEHGSTFANARTESRPAKSLSPGDKVGPYEIIAFIGAGGMGEVYRAHDRRLRRDIALKVLPIGFMEDPERPKRFEREAHAAAALNHPRIAAIYGLEESDGVFAIAMELVDGSTLANLIERGPIPIRDLLAIAKQIAEALQYAHEKGIVHQDLKPANMMVTGEGKVKLLDFGLARRVDLTETGVNTGEGQVAGTIGYMAPEQMRGSPVDHRTDLFSFGVVLHEMATGERHFTGTTDRGRAPRKLYAIIRQLLEKDPANRYANAGQVVRDLEALEASLAPMRRPKRAWIAVGTLLVLATVIAGWLWHKSARERWALEQAAPEMARLIDAGEYVKAASLAREARAALPKDPGLERLWIRATGEVSVASLPSGAEVSIRRYQEDPNSWEHAGSTPLTKVRMPQDAYLWRVMKSGFAPIFFIGEPLSAPAPGFHVGLDLKLKLRPEAQVPRDMVVVPGARVGLAYPLAYAPVAQVDDFLIDRHEVTNEEYKRFLDAGGYQKRDFWKQPFIRNGLAVPWEEAIALFHDGTGRPGPATWEAGEYPKGLEKHPVAGVSWYEAAAYAEFAGKNLPTAYHWTRASQAIDYTPLITSGSNFRRDGTQPVGAEGTLSGFGTTDMAGNVKEWCWNETKGGKRVILGGGFGEPAYMFNHTDAQSPWARLANFGFRCVKLDSPPGAAASARIDVTTRDYWKEKPLPDAIVNAYTALYAYDKSELNAQVEETATMDGWSRTKVTFDAAYGHERVPAYLFLPKNASPPFCCLFSGRVRVLGRETESIRHRRRPRFPF